MKIELPILFLIILLQAVWIVRLYAEKKSLKNNLLKEIESERREWRDTAARYLKKSRTLEGYETDLRERLNR